ncbi:DNA cytosine methyltransferase [Undibacterium sp. CY7W]|uniref:DNA (cytosine-5-)-methyltransferase n=1 Tax=Undibacterium rugosum TaxID=2762291 RepID=A0A923I6E4_9BURK|nr:DNA cytosine methyltransferase [Undibacterium rugosum]MBC3936999.1 DNA cytosine methyltransferase [Undibacterium rugosum]
MKFKKFIVKPTKSKAAFNFVSLFSGAGFGDYGLALAGGRCLAAAEIDKNRAGVHKLNIKAPIWGNICTEKDNLVNSLSGFEVDLLIATPPCQSFSTANAKRGLREDPEHADRDSRNHLFFEALSVARAINPKIIFFENVPNFLERKIKTENGKFTGRVREFISASLNEYCEWSGTICFSNLGIPQRRKRSVAIFVRRDLLPNEDRFFPENMTPLKWPLFPTELPVTILDALSDLPSLDSKDISTAVCPTDALHQVPVVSSTHYTWISSIPSGSNKSAWENGCLKCGAEVELDLIKCKKCGEILFNRPHMIESDGRVRLIKGFKTSYKRMPANDISPTITTASGSFSSDLKLHPTQNRVLSIRECARLQAIPDSFIWPAAFQDKKGHNFREMIGEAVPSIITYRFGKAITRFLRG